MLAAIMANAHRDSKKKKDPFSVEDFVPTVDLVKGSKKKRGDKRPPQMSVQQMIRKVEQLNVLFGGRDLRTGKGRDG